ncbi:MAG: hypothetical protein J6B08_05610 [Ruminiclostridium sp.]|nr:hypothetical protein [Ruminiclostridium sp.]
MKSIKIIPLLLGCSLLLTGCDSKEQKAENEKNLRQAEKNAVAYIEEKYGFTPEIIESVLERYGGLFGSTPHTSALIRMNHNSKDFSVYIDGSTKNTDGADNYQQEEIISALTEKLSEKAENTKGVVGEIKSINIDGGKVKSFRPIVEWNCENLYSEYFDGENFAEVFGDEICCVTADYIEADFENLQENDFDFLLSNERVRLSLISYRTEEDYLNRPDYGEFSDFTGIKKHAILIEESFVFGKDGADHNEYVLGKHDNFYYYVFDNTPNTVSFSSAKMPDASEFDGHGIIDGQFVTPAYSINSSVNERIYIYYPLSELPEKSRLATSRKTADGNDVDISPLAYDIGDYRMAYIQASEFKDAYLDGNPEISFAFITEKENINNEQ